MLRKAYQNLIYFSFLIILLILIEVPSYALSMKQSLKSDDAIEKEVVAFVLDWLALSQENKNFDKIMKMYDKDVDFYKFGKIKKAGVAADKKKYFARWPKREHRMMSLDVALGTEESEITADVRFQYRIRNAKRGAKEGKVYTYLIIKRINDSYVICSEKSEPPHQTTKPPRFVVYDSETFYTVFPDEIIIYNDWSHLDKIRYQKSFSKEDAISQFKDGHVPQSYFNSLGLAPGNYPCRIIRNNYDNRGLSSCRVNGRQKETGKLNGSSQITRSDSVITPIVSPVETQSDYLISLKQKGTMIFTGFIVDDESGFPIEGAHITLSDRSASSTTDRRGYFVMRIPMPDAPGNLAMITMVFEKDGFKTIERRSVPIWSPGSTMYRFRLEPGRGLQIKDEKMFRRW